MSTWGSLRFIVEDFEAKLKPTATHKAGQAASGKVERERYKGGEEEFDLRVYKLELLDGDRVDILLEGNPIGTMSIDGGRGALLINSSSGATVPTVKVGDVIEVRHRGETILSGVFYLD